MRVAVLCGGPSFERQISIAGADRVVHALGELGHRAIQIDVGRDLVERLTDARADAAIIVMHGAVGEDGAVQAVVEALGLPHQSPGSVACRRCWDKAIAKGLLADADIAVPDGVVFDRQPFTSLGAARALAPIVERLGWPLVVKPARSGSALGVRRVDSMQQLAQAVVGAFSYDDAVVVERFIAGRELAVSVLSGKALPVVEIVQQDGPGEVYDFEARYTIGESHYFCPAKLSDVTTDAVLRTAERAAESLGIDGICRVDLILTEDATPVVLEVNAVPGMTDTSLLPMAASAAGMSFSQLVAKMLPAG